MKIGVVKEIKQSEYRVGLVPAGVHELTGLGHEVYFEKNAGIGSGVSDEDYENAGGLMLDSASEVYLRSDIIVKVKEPLEAEYELLREGQTIFTYLHLAADKTLAEKLLEKKITGIGYETVTDRYGKLPLLMPMSEVAGRLAVQIGANILLKNNGGSGILLGGVPGVEQGTILIIGGGIVGLNAAKMAVGLGAKVIIMDVNVSRLRELDNIFGTQIQTVAYSAYNAAEYVKSCDLLISSVLIPGGKAPKIVTEEMVKTMKKASVIVDVAVDQGGSIETIDRVTSHDAPTYVKHGVIHYSVANMPGGVPQTSTKALTNVTFPFLKELVKTGVTDAIKSDPHLRDGVNTYMGHITHKAVAESLELEYKNLDELL